MELNEITRLRDNRTDCYSIIFEITIKDYIQLIDEIYRNKGGLKEQREPLKSSSAMRIRKQMVKDIKLGTILPPIVLGLIVDKDQFESIVHIGNENLTKIIVDSQNGNLTIIDGMQRTTALNEAIEEGANPEQKIRVEFWISTKLNSLIYRMLVLNTGQVPWNLRRQVETVFSSMINEMRTEIPEMTVFEVDTGRRVQGGQYHANELVELYLSFGARKEKVDTKERLADEFTRLDFIEATENSNFSDFFYSSLKFMTLMDIEFSRYIDEKLELRFNNGQDLFRSQPARVGLITSIAKSIYGRPGFEKSNEEIKQAKDLINSIMEKFIFRVKTFNIQELKTFLALGTLSEKLSIKTSKVGDFEREYFTKAFETFLEEGEMIRSMEICWLSY